MVMEINHGGNTMNIAQIPAGQFTVRYGDRRRRIVRAEAGWTPPGFERVVADGWIVGTLPVSGAHVLVRPNDRVGEIAYGGCWDGWDIVDVDSVAADGAVWAAPGRKLAAGWTPAR